MWRKINPRIVSSGKGKAFPISAIRNANIFPAMAETRRTSIAYSATVHYMNMTTAGESLSIWKMDAKTVLPVFCRIGKKIMDGL